MKLFYVEHSVLKTARYALLAEDEDDLKLKLAEREAIVKAAPFIVKLQRDKAGKVEGHQLSTDWNVLVPQAPWDGK